MILTLSCPDQPGIVARVSAFLFERGANILDAQQYDDQETGRFFMRVVFDALDGDIELLRTEFEILADGFSMRWRARKPGRPSGITSISACSLRPEGATSWRCASNSRYAL